LTSQFRERGREGGERERGEREREKAREIRFGTYYAQLRCSTTLMEL